MNFIKHPKSIGSNLKIAALSAMWLFHRKMKIWNIDINKNTSVDIVSIRVNGGKNGINKREKQFKNAQKIIKDCN
jgi:predicted chitinase